MLIMNGMEYPSKGNSSQTKPVLQRIYSSDLSSPLDRISNVSITPATVSLPSRSVLSVLATRMGKAQRSGKARDNPTTRSVKVDWKETGRCKSTCSTQNVFRKESERKGSKEGFGDLTSFASCGPREKKPYWL